MTDPNEAETLATRLASTLREARETARRGDHQRAYQLSTEVTRASPENISAWLLCVETAPSIEEAVDCLNQANSLQPGNLEAHRTTYRIVRALLQSNPQLTYLNETEAHYNVQSSEQISLIVPKDRHVPKIIPADSTTLFGSAYRWLGLAALGLLPAGLGAIVFAPLAGLTAFRLNLLPLSRQNRIHSLLLIILSGGLWLCGLLLGVILLVHLI
jgi:hypothetical protein